MRALIAMPMVIGLGLLLAGAGCGGPARVRYQEQLAEEAPSAQHAVHTDRLQEVMKGLERVTEDRLPPGMDLEEAKAVRVADLVAAARGIAESAELIPEAALQASLSRSEHVTFHQRAAELRRRALALAEDAPTMTPDERSEAVAGIQATCQSCHDTFRTPRDHGG